MPSKKRYESPKKRRAVREQKVKEVSQILQSLIISERQIFLIARSSCTKELIISRLNAMNKANIPLKNIFSKLTMPKESFRDFIEARTLGISATTLGDYRKTMKKIHAPTHVKITKQFNHLSGLKPSNSSDRKKDWKTVRKNLLVHLEVLKTELIGLNKLKKLKRADNFVKRITNRLNTLKGKPGKLKLEPYTREELMKSFNLRLKISNFELMEVLSRTPGKGVNSNEAKRLIVKISNLNEYIHLIENRKIYFNLPGKKPLAQPKKKK